MINFCVYECTCAYVNLCAPCVCRCPQKPAEGTRPLELKVKTVVSHLIWVLGSKPGPLEEE